MLAAQASTRQPSRPCAPSVRVYGRRCASGIALHWSCLLLSHWWCLFLSHWELEANAGSLYPSLSYAGCLLDLFLLVPLRNRSQCTVFVLQFSTCGVPLRPVRRQLRRLYAWKKPALELQSWSCSASAGCLQCLPATSIPMSPFILLSCTLCPQGCSVRKETVCI